MLITGNWLLLLWKNTLQKNLGGAGVVCALIKLSWSELTICDHSLEKDTQYNAYHLHSLKRFGGWRDWVGVCEKDYGEDVSAECVFITIVHSVFEKHVLLNSFTQSAVHSLQLKHINCY